MSRGLGNSHNIVAQYATLFALIEAIEERGNSSGSGKAAEEQRSPIQTSLTLEQLIRLIRHNTDLRVTSPQDKIGTARASGYLTAGGFPRLTITGQIYLAEHGMAVRTEAVKMVVEQLRPRYRNHDGTYRGKSAPSRG